MRKESQAKGPHVSRLFSFSRRHSTPVHSCMYAGAGAGAGHAADSVFAPRPRILSCSCRWLTFGRRGAWTRRGPLSRTPCALGGEEIHGNAPASASAASTTTDNSYGVRSIRTVHMYLYSSAHDAPAAETIFCSVRSMYKGIGTPAKAIW